MNWGGGRRQQVLAGVYLASWVSWLIGVAWTLLIQLTSDAEPPAPMAIAGVLFVGGVLGITAVAYLLRDRVPAPAGKLMANAANYQRGWQRLMLGIELRTAVRVLRG